MFSVQSVSSPLLYPTFGTDVKHAECLALLLADSISSFYCSKISPGMHRSGYVELHKSNECLHPSNAISLNSLSTKWARYFIFMRRNRPYGKWKYIVNITCNWPQGWRPLNLTSGGLHQDGFHWSNWSGLKDFKMFWTFVSWSGWYTSWSSS